MGKARRKGRGGESRLGPRPERAAELPPEVLEEIETVVPPRRRREVKQALLEAGLALAGGDPGRAHDAAERAKRLSHRLPAARELLALSHYRLGHFKEALREGLAYRRLTGRRDLDPVIADSMRARGNPQAASELLADLRPEEVDEETWVEGLIVRAGALLDQGLVHAALACLMQGPLETTVVEEYHLRLWYALARTLLAAGKAADARQWLERIHAIDPDLFDVEELLQSPGGE
jgi:tetratricopeptide (TPR) repeat protein